MLLTTNEVAEFAEASLRQLQWWDDHHLIQPEHHGHTRRYTVEEATAARVVAELRRKNVSLKIAWKAARVIMKNSPILDGRDLDGRFLCVLGSRIRIVDRAQVLDAFTYIKGGGYLVEIKVPDIARLSLDRAYLRRRRNGRRWH
jgi:hypothetical protein